MAWNQDNASEWSDLINLKYSSIGIKQQPLPHFRATCFINRLESVFVINVIKFGQEKLVRPRKNIPVFPLTCSEILGSVGRKKILFFLKFLASFYRGHILTLIVLVQKWQTKIRVGRVNGNTCNFFCL